MADDFSGRPQAPQYVVWHGCSVSEFGGAVGQLVYQVDHVLWVSCYNSTAVGEELGESVCSSLAVASLFGWGALAAAVGAPQRIDPLLERRNDGGTGNGVELGVEMKHSVTSRPVTRFSLAAVLTVSPIGINCRFPPPGPLTGLLREQIGGHCCGHLGQAVCLLVGHSSGSIGTRCRMLSGDLARSKLSCDYWHFSDPAGDFSVFLCSPVRSTRERASDCCRVGTTITECIDRSQTGESSLLSLPDQMIECSDRVDELRARARTRVQPLEFLDRGRQHKESIANIRSLINPGWTPFGFG